MAVPANLTINWDNVNTLTGRKFLPKLTDNIFRSNPTIMKLWKGGTKIDGGAFIVQPLIYGEGPGGSFEGMQPLDTSEAEQITAAVFNWKHYFASATIRRMDELKNSGEPAFMKLLSAKMQIMQKTMKNRLAIALFGDGLDPKEIGGLGALVTGTGTTYGGISRTTNAWWRAITDSTTTTMSIPALRNMCGQLTEDSDTPDFIVTTQAIYDKYYLQLQPQQRFADASMAKGGFTSVLFEGRTLVVDSHCPTATLYMLNTDYIDLVSHSAENMRLEPWVKPYNQAGRTAFLFWAGNLTCSNSRFQGKFTALTA